MDGFVTTHTELVAVPFVPELRMYTASDVVKLWEHTELETGATQPPPFWAFPWAGGQALARYVLDHPAIVQELRVLDLASGSGLVAIAAVRAGAAAVLANEVDPHADAAIAANAAANGVHLDRHLGDMLASTPDVDVVLAGDVFYSRQMADRMLEFMRRLRARGASVLVGDPGRAYAPHDALDVIAAYDVPVIRDLEDADVKHVTVSRVR